MNIKKLFDTLGKILSEKENANIKFIVKEGESNVGNKLLSASERST